MEPACQLYILCIIHLELHHHLILEFAFKEFEDKILRPCTGIRLALASKMTSLSTYPKKTKQLMYITSVLNSRIKTCHNNKLWRIVLSANLLDDGLIVLVVV